MHAPNSRQGALCLAIPLLLGWKVVRRLVRAETSPSPSRRRRTVAIIVETLAVFNTEPPQRLGKLSAASTMSSRPVLIACPHGRRGLRPQARSHPPSDALCTPAPNFSSIEVDDYGSNGAGSG